MRQPRRVPWASKADLATLYDEIFSPSANETTRAAALSQLGVYISSPSCPAFMHLLHALVNALQLPYPPGPSSSNATRMVYAMAITRFVNGLVDPLQTGLHARPISHLAASIHLPPGLVALRHRATHEDLPPLPVLRRAVEQAMAYLHDQSMLPLLEAAPAAASRAESLVADWKRVVKARVRERDVSTESKSGVAMRKLLREMESVDVDEVLDSVVRFGLVPVARRKRPGPRATEPPAEHQQVWTPLLAKLGESSPIGGRFGEALVAVLAEPVQVDDPDVRKEVDTYRWTLGLWLAFVWGAMVIPDETRVGIKRRLARELVHGDRVLRRVYGLLNGHGPELDELEALLPVPGESGERDSDELAGLEIDTPIDIDIDAALDTMQANLKAVERLSARPSTRQSQEPTETPGWHRAEHWQPCPIGLWA